MFVATEVGDEECNNCKCGSNGKVACNISTSREERNKSHTVTEENEEEKSKKIRQIFLVVGLPYHRTDNTVTNKNHKHFYQ